MTSLFGSLEPYTPERPFSEWFERLEFYLEANQVEEDNKKRAILLSMVGPVTFRTIKDLCFPSSPKDKQFGEICKLLTEHFNPTPPKFVQRKKFEERVRLPSETVQEYLLALKKLSEFCQFGANLNERLLDRFVMGVNHEAVQKKLLQEDKLSIDKALNIAQSMIESSKGAKTFESTAAVDLHFFSKSTIKSNSSKPRSNKQTSFQPCFTCGGTHPRHTCRFRDSVCHNCGKKGHLRKVCRSTSKQVQIPQQNKPKFNTTKKKFAQHQVEEDEEQSYDLYSIDGKSTSDCYRKPILVKFQINSKNINFQVDTGASLTVIDKSTFYENFKGENSAIEKSKKILMSYTGERVKVLGEKEVTVCYEQKEFKLPLIVVDTNGPPLLGRNWLHFIKLNWSEIFKLDSETIDQVLQRHSKVFSEQLGCLKDFKASITVDQDAVPKFSRARTVPFSQKEGIERELERLEREGVIEKVTFSDWASPIVPVPKSTGQTRLCGDYKNTINPVLKGDKFYPLPTKQDLLIKLQGGKTFSEIDLSNAYNQIALDENSKRFTTINTHKGLYQYTRLVFGISSAPSIFQRTLECLLQDIDNCVCYIDNIYITGKTDKEHLQTLEKVLSRLETSGLQVRKEKCSFMKPEVSFLGYQLTSEGVKPQEDKLRAIRAADPPENIHQLRAFLGMMNYYGSFIPNLSSELAILYSLLDQKQAWHWTRQHQDCFMKAKELLTSDRLLVHFDPQKPIVLSCDASPYGLGAVLSHIMSDGQERPIAFASRTLMAAEKNYSQIDKEGLSLTFGVKKFHKFIYGRPIVIYTDHKPLLGLLGENKPIPQTASARVIRWALTLSAYDYQLRYRQGQKHSNCDALSRLPLKNDKINVIIPQEVHDLFSVLDHSQVTSAQIAKATQEDPVLSKILDLVKNGWNFELSSNRNSQFQPFLTRKHELSCENECLMWGSRVVIPNKLRTQVLDMLHESHPGICRMKSLARSYVWWPQIDKDVELFVKDCYQCQKHQKTPPKVPLQPWSFPPEPWSRIHLDFAGPFMGSMFLVLVDPFSKWIDVKVMSNITAENTILQLRGIFANFGLPECIVTDNGPTFTSEKFQTFLKRNGVKHITSAPFHPATNGAAEKTVQTFKNAMKKMDNKGPIEEKVLKFLTRYRATPHTTTGLTPSELLLGRKIRTHLDLLFPSLYDSVSDSVTRQKINYDNKCTDREINVNDKVFVRNYSTHGDNWVPGIVMAKTGPVSFQVKTKEQNVIRRHANQLKPGNCSLPIDSSPISGSSTQTVPNFTEGREIIETQMREEDNAESSESFNHPNTDISEFENKTINADPVPSATPPVLRRSERTRKAPDKLDL